MRLDSDFEYKFGPKEKFRQIKFTNRLNVRGPWSFWLDVILIDTDSAVQTSLESSKNLDQVWLGAGYDI